MIQFVIFDLRWYSSWYLIFRWYGSRYLYVFVYIFKYLLDVWFTKFGFTRFTSHKDESCHAWMSHATHVCVMSHIKELLYICMRHVPYERVMFRINESCDIWMSPVICNGPRHTRISHVKYTRVTSCSNGSCHIRVMSRIIESRHV